MHHICKSKKRCLKVEVHIGLESERGINHLMDTTAAHSDDLTPPARLLKRKETMVDMDARY